MSGNRSPRDSHLDLLKLVAAQCIVWHHFSAYGPMSDDLEVLVPWMSQGLFDYGRMAVQVFLVVGGYLAVHSLDLIHTGRRIAFGATVLRRYRRLALPLLASLVLTGVCATVTRQWIQEDWIPGVPTWTQAGAHLLLLQDVLGIGALSVGVWYVAIDFQFFVLMTLLLWLGQQQLQIRRLGQVLVVAAALASLFYFNHDEGWDRWALYFFAAYGMGACIAWAQRSGKTNAVIALMTLTVLAALVLHFRGRILLALLVALTLAVAPTLRRTWSPGLARWISLLGKSSYALFLVHFSVLMLCNVAYVMLGLSGRGALLGMGLVFVVTSTTAGLAFARYVEGPLSRWGDRRPGA